PAKALEAEILATQLPEERFWRMLCSLSTTFENNRQLAKMAMYRTLGRASPGDSDVRLGGCIADVEAALARAKPTLVDELRLRGGPLREQWEARGPGLLTNIFTKTDKRLEVDAADVVLVLPVLGGGGEAQLQNNSVRLEAVLANPHAQLPEVVRLAWMLAQLHLDLPIFSEGIDPERLPLVAALAMIPPTLEAAEFVELVKFNDDLVRFALDAWRVPVPPGIDATDIVMRWWEAFDLARPPLEVAFRALSEMLPP
ncbi:MAG TPA: hypothetical protein VL096_12910, partial [Pirellulaceae bacterium]|nr:hypothetical protein [Pirellulaceae bacterium]